MEKESFPLILKKKTVISVVGLEKNIGKTSTVNYLIDLCNQKKKKCLVISTGRDGENLCLVYKVQKPGIKIPKGNYFISAEGLEKNYNLFQIVDTYQINTIAGRVFLGKALESTEIQAINPGNLDLICSIAQNVISRGICDIVFVDGSLDRYAHSSSKLSENIVLVTGAQVSGSEEEVSEKTLFALNRLETEECEADIKKRIQRILEENDFSKTCTVLLGGEKEVYFPYSVLDNQNILEKVFEKGYIFISGVLSERVSELILNKQIFQNIIVSDSSKIMIDQKQLKRLERNGIKVQCLKKVFVLGISVNSTGIRRTLNPSSLISKLKEKIPNKYIFDIFLP